MSMNSALALDKQSKQVDNSTWYVSGLGNQKHGRVYFSTLACKPQILHNMFDQTH